MNNAFGLSALKSDFSIYSVVFQPISDVDTADLAVRTLFHGQHLTQIDTIGIVNPLDHIVPDSGIDRPIVAKNPSVFIRSRYVMDIVVPDLYRHILRIDIDSPRIHQEVLGSLFSIGFRLVNLIVLDQARAGVLHGLREMQTGHDGTTAIVDEPVSG